MKNKLALVLLFLAAFFGACSDARFNSVPGDYLEVIPTELQGKYHFSGTGIHSNLLDSLVIEVNQNELKLSANNERVDKVIHQDFKMNRVHDLFVIGTPDKTFKSLFNLMVIQPVKDGIRVYFVNENRYKADDLSVIQKYMVFRDLIFHHEPLVPSPSPGDVGAVGPGQAPGGENMVKYYETNQELFWNYFDQELRDKEYVLLLNERAFRKLKKK